MLNFSKIKKKFGKLKNRLYLYIMKMSEIKKLRPYRRFNRKAPYYGARLIINEDWKWEITKEQQEKIPVIIDWLVKQI